MTAYPWRLARVTIDGDAHAAGRAAARRAVELLLGEARVIRRADDGAPEADGCLVSISHGRREAVAVAGVCAALGVDLTDPEDDVRVRRVAPRWCHASEQPVAAADPCAFWAIKEAAAKALRHGLLDGGLKATEVLSTEPPRLAGDWQCVVIRGGNDVVAVVWR